MVIGKNYENHYKNLMWSTTKRQFPLIWVLMFRFTLVVNIYPIMYILNSDISKYYHNIPHFMNTEFKHNLKSSKYTASNSIETAQSAITPTCCAALLSSARLVARFLAHCPSCMAAAWSVTVGTADFAEVTILLPGLGKKKKKKVIEYNCFKFNWKCYDDD